VKTERKFALAALLLLTACAHLDQVESGIRKRGLAGSWKSESGGYLLIGCSGAFNVNRTEGEFPLTWKTAEQGAHLSEVNEKGFVVSHFPFASGHYHVEQWPQEEKGNLVMRMEGERWVRQTTLDCN
jgi:hypothetical protein